MAFLAADPSRLAALNLLEIPTSITASATRASRVRDRRLADAICDIYFAPTLLNQSNLLAEGHPAENVIVTGNTVIDALLSILPKARQLTPQKKDFDNIDWSLKTILVTCHRRESFGYQLEAICTALKTIVQQLSEVNIIYPVHRNPHVLGPVTKLLGNVERIYLTEPMDYLPFVWLMDRCYLVLTDSGGIQEEAPSLDKPVLVMRNKTERVEAVQQGAVVLTGTNPKRIVDEVCRLVRQPTAYQKMAVVENPYGDGKAAVRIVDGLLRLGC